MNVVESIPASAGNMRGTAATNRDAAVHPRVGGEAPDVRHLSAQVEDFFAALPEMLPMLPQHYEELALDKCIAPLAPRWDVYRRLYDEGQLMLVTLRERGRLIGYCWTLIAPGLHYGETLEARVDIFWVHPKVRGRMGGVRLFRAVEAELKRRGVKRWFAGSKLHRDSGRLLAAMGMRPIETYYSKLME